MSATDRDRKALARIPGVEGDLRREFQRRHRRNRKPPMNCRLPSLTCVALKRTYRRASVNTIPTEAAPRLIFVSANETPERSPSLSGTSLRGFSIVRQTPDAVARLASAKIVKVEWGSGYPASRTPLDLPFSRELAAIMAAAGHEPVCLPTAGGSLPMDLFQQGNNAPVIAFPIANHDDNQHAANENVRLQNIWDGIEVFASFFTSLDNAKN